MSEELDKIRFEREVLTSDREFELKRREQEIREADFKKPFWRDPVVVGLMGAILALLGNIYATSKNEKTSREVSKQNADLAAKTSRQNALLQSIIEVIHNDPEKAETKLDILLRTGVIDDENGKIRDAVNSSLFKQLQTASTSKPPEKHPTSEETILVQKTIEVSPGGYASEPDPACTITEFNNPEAMASKFGKDSTDLLFSQPNGTAPSCAALRLAVPTGKKVSRVLFEASEDGQNWLPCGTPDGQWNICGVGWSAWGKFEGPTFVGGVFKNWSHNRTRKARISIIGGD
jgi:hypothetical protein